MQIKTINKVITAKMNAWLASIPDNNLVTLLKKHILVTGGSIASMLLGEDVNDFDVYLQDKDTLKRLMKHYNHGFDLEILDGAQRAELLDKYSFISEKEDELIGHRVTAIRNLTPERLRFFIGTGGGKAVNQDVPEDTDKYVVKYFSPNAISLSNKVQIVIRFHGTPEQIHDNFDFMHATNYWTYDTGVVTNLVAMTSLLTRHLKYGGSKYPVTSILRAKKFILRKWNIGAGEYLKIMFQISKLDLTDIDTLEDQLVGVDVAYFDTLITALRAKPAETELSDGYLGSLIDKIFGE